MTTFKQLNLVKDFQISLAELGLYQSKIDGVVGGESLRGLSTLLGLPILASTDYNEVIFYIQTGLQKKGYYTGKLDSIWGSGSQGAFNKAVAEYRVANNLPRYSAAWSNRVPEKFVSRIYEWVTSKDLDVRAVDWLMSIMCFETGGSFSPTEQNKAGAQAFGLIQFMAPAAKDLGTDLKTLTSLTAIQQLEFVFLYFEMRMRRFKLKTLEDFYLSVFYPAAIGKAADDILFYQNQQATNKAYIQNSGLDINNDKMIAVGEIAVKIYKTYYDGMLPSNRRVL